MSRCFPYPPPGYLQKGPLIGSIKLQKDKEKAKEVKIKERKREKKDRKRKRERQSSPTDTFGKQKPFNEKQTLGDDVSSDVTEEHERPVSVLKPCYLSENSDKRRPLESPARKVHASGSNGKIRLSSFKKKESNAYGRNDAGPSNFHTIDLIGQIDFGFGQRFVKGQPCGSSTSAKIFVPGITPLEKQPTLEKQPSILKTQITNEDVTVSKPSTSKSSKGELLYKSLLESWVSPILGSEQGFDDDEQDWFFRRKFLSTERSEPNTNVSCSLDSNLWPRAQYLPSSNIYAFPYTVPF